MNVLHPSALSPLYRFATIRNAKESNTSTSAVSVAPTTSFVSDLLDIISSTDNNNAKLENTNTLLQEYINSDDFIKSKEEFFDKINIDIPSTVDLEQMYDNILIRILTKSNTNEVYKLLIKHTKEFGASLSSTTVDLVRIIYPENLSLPFLSFEPKTPRPDNPPSKSFTLSAITSHEKVKTLVEKAKLENIVSILSEGSILKLNKPYLNLLSSLQTKSISLTDAQTIINNELSTITASRAVDRKFPQIDGVFASEASSVNNIQENNVRDIVEKQKFFQKLKKYTDQANDAALTTISEYIEVSDSTYNEILVTLLHEGPLTIEKAESIVDAKLKELYKTLGTLLTDKNYALIGGSWHDVSAVFTNGVYDNETASVIINYSDGCHLKFPLLVADLKVVEHQAVGYLPAEIAHINNTQRGEKQSRVTRRLTRSETEEKYLIETEVFKETDSQSTEKFSMESAAYNMEQEQNSFNVNLSASGSMGPYSATINTGYSTSSSTQSGDTSSQGYAKEIFTRVVDRVSNRTRSERTLRTLEEFEETVTHEIDNTGAETKSYVYRWLNKLVRGTLRNYGKRLIVEVTVPHPAHLYLAGIANSKNTIKVPEDPRLINNGGSPFMKPENITAQNYVTLGNSYGVQIDPPPASKIIVSDTFSSSSEKTVTGKMIPIPNGYRCIKATVSETYSTGYPYRSQIRILVGNWAIVHYNHEDDLYPPATAWLNNETVSLPVSIMQLWDGFIMNIEVECWPTDESMKEWQLNAYHKLIEGYEKLRDDAEAKMNGFDFNAPGMSPLKKLELITEEIKRESIRKMFRCNPFWIDDQYKVGKEYDPKCCADGKYGEKIRFLETAFDWKNMTFEFHPYFYADKSVWGQLLELSDDDPLFESFLKSSMATVRIPVHRDYMKEISVCNFLLNNSIANFDVLPAAMKDLLTEFKDEPVANFEYDINGVPLLEPVEVVDLGVFPVPTNLVILECGTENGVKPIGFPQAEVFDTDMIIPKQYSPAVIADNCDAEFKSQMQLLG